MNKVFFSLGFIGCMALPGIGLAAAPIINEPVRPYEPLPVDAAIERAQIYLGELAGDPHMYEVTIGEEKEFSVTLIQEDTEVMVPVSFILVKENAQNRGVREVGRIEGKKIEWDSYRDSNFAMRFRKAETFTATLDPGVYRFEVSTPENIGKYMLLVGTEANGDGYFTELSNIRQVQKFFGHSFLLIFLSSYLLYPLGSLILICLIYWTWSKNKRSKNEVSPEHA